MSAAALAPRPARHARPRLTVRSVLRAALDRLAAIDMSYRQRVDLMALDEHLLKDIGITRAEVARALRGL